MAIEFNCPHCQHAYRLKDELAGKTATCKTCRNKITIPQPVTVPEGPPRMSAEEAAEAEARALAALADEQAQAENDPAEQVIPVECQHCNHKWTEPLARAGKNALCPECRQRIKIPEPTQDQLTDWRQQHTKRPSLAKPAFEKPADAMDMGDVQIVTGGSLKQAGADGIEYEPRSIKRMAMFGFVILALVGGSMYGVVSLFRSRGVAQEDKLMQKSLEEFGQTVGSLPASEAPAEVQLLGAVLSIAAGEHAVRHNEPKKLQEAIEHFAKARDAVRKAPPSSVRYAVAAELAVATLLLAGEEQQISEQLRIRWTPESAIRPRLNERVYTVHEELRLTLALLQGAEFDFKNHLARRLARGLAQRGQAALAVDLIPLTLFAPFEQDEGRALVALEVYRLDKGSPIVRKVMDELKARGPALMQGTPTPSSAQTLFLALDGDKPRQFIQPPATDPVSDASRLAYAGKHLLDGQPEEALKLAQRRGTPDGQVRALVLCADWSADPGPALDVALGLVTANKANKAFGYSVLRLTQIAAEKGRPDQAKELAKLIGDDGLQAWAQGSAVAFRSAASKERADDSWAELPAADKMPKDLRAGHVWGRLWAARHNTRLSHNQSAEVKAVSAWPTAVGPFGRAGIALGLQDQ
ncbi:hypothetical protein R5W24_003299 [Gemmata sp. JC717]|uniref:hypothetical protein n=1 Tax=Gemmata algarum TaxID=2975278 RepID=UPI0021BAB724|nr:hypothetical protein [Gemmata algarum]MDY3554180.1 hypothetical protein [Gemmata algarum]